MKYSVIIPTYNRPYSLKRALDTIIIQSIKPAEIIIIDQSTNSETEKIIKEYYLKKIKLKYISIKKRSTAKARNIGLKQAENTLIMFFDDDVELDKYYAENIITFIQQNKHVIGISGTDINAKEPEGIKWKIRKTLMKFFLISNFKGNITISGYGYPIYERQITKTTYVNTLPGCNMCFLKEKINGIYFDEWFTGYAFREDVDYTYRVSKKGKLAMIPSAKLKHLYSPKNRLDLKKLKIMEARNYYYFYKKLIRKNILTDFLFTYSTFGILLIYLFEYILNPLSKDKKQQFIGFLEGCFNIIFKGKKFLNK